MDSTLSKMQPSTLIDIEKTNFTANGIANNPDSETGSTPRGSAVRQVLAALVAQLGTINTGMAFGFSAIALPQLQEPDSIIPIKEGSTEESWIGAYKSCHFSLVSPREFPFPCYAKDTFADSFNDRIMLDVLLTFQLACRPSARLSVA